MAKHQRLTYPRLRFALARLLIKFGMKQSEAVSKVGVSSTWYYRMKNHK